MATVGLRELSRETRKVIEQLEESREPVLIVRRGKPIAALVTVDGENLNQMLLESLPEFVKERRQADEELAAGKTRPLSEVMAEIEANEPEDDEDPATGDEAEGPFHDLLLAWSAKLDSPDLVAAIGAPPEVGSGPKETEEIGALNQELLRRFADNALLEAFQQVRNVNSNLADALRRQGNLSSPEFKEALERVTNVERLVRPTLIDLGPARGLVVSGKELADEEKEVEAD